MNNHPRISIKTKEEIQILRDAGKILSSILEEVKCSLKSGMTTCDVDMLTENLMRKNRVVPAFKGYRGFPGCACVSINEEVVHGIPGDKVLKDGDIVSIDVGLIHQDYYSDMAITIGIGEIVPALTKLIDVTYESLMVGIEQAYVDNRLSDISHAIQKHIEQNQLSVVKEYVGHGIGKHLHEDPEIPNFGEPKQGPVLKEGMVFAIEPMVNMGDWKTSVLEDGWTVVTKDGKPSAHFEHSIVITNNGPEILTR